MSTVKIPGNKSSAKDPKNLGQFFTGQIVADYMASLCAEKPRKGPIRVLDPGAGEGILGIAAARKLLNQPDCSIHLTAYEIDSEIIPKLQANLSTFARENKAFSFEIRQRDFVLSRTDFFRDSYDIAVLNPPYFKYNSKSSPYANATSDLFRGNPNIYASFVSVSMEALKRGGTLVAIIPRSFANGLYFKGFRFFLRRTSGLNHIHIFRSRSDVFGGAGVLQENVIVRHSKGPQPESISVAVSNGVMDISAARVLKHPARRIMEEDTGHAFIRIPESQKDIEIMRLVEDWPSSFKENGYSISTGPVVEHRTREFIMPPLSQGSIPLLRMHNAKPIYASWNGEHRKDACFALDDGHEKHTSENIPSVLLKRFTSKDEKKRLVASFLDPRKVRGERIAFENHLNVIRHSTDALTSNEALGLVILLNSTILDRYFRCISGNTQVNATEIRLLRLPKRETIEVIGKVYNCRTFRQDKADEALKHGLESPVEIEATS